MKEWKKVLISPSASIREALQTIEENAMQIALVVDDSNRLLGTVTDGDIRRGILRGLSLDEAVPAIMNDNPTVASLQDGKETILAIMKAKVILQVPILDDNGRVISLEILEDLLRSQQRDNWVVLMAGGLATRLLPLTTDCPKPLLRVGNKPLLETILESFIEHGFRRFYISVNFKAEMVEEYFGDGSRWGVEIRYIREDRSMGTAGALTLLPEKPNQPFFVMNADLLTKVNFQQLLNFHQEHKAQATMCVREFDFHIPYGVARVVEHRLVGIEEKPVLHFFVSAGIYVLEPEVLDLIPANSFYDMPCLFQQLIEQGYETASFPIREYWIDIGHKDDFERANGEYDNHFSEKVR